MIYKRANFIKITVFTWIFTLYAAFFVNFHVYAEDNIQYFNEKLTISLISNINIGMFNHNYDSVYTTNNPLYIGLGFRYKFISAQYTFPIPFKNSSFDLEINPYFDRIYYHIYLKYYEDFRMINSNKKSKLDALFAAITATYVVNHENHSLSSIINLDKKQTASSGSFLYAFGTFLSSIYSSDETLEEYNERQNIVYFGPGIGYSYTWVFGNDIFLNASMVIFTNIGINYIIGNWDFVPQMEPRIVFGQHKNTWSFNINFSYNSEFILKEHFDFDILTLFSISTLISKRF